MYENGSRYVQIKIFKPLHIRHNFARLNAQKYFWKEEEFTVPKIESVPWYGYILAFVHSVAVILESAELARLTKALNNVGGCQDYRRMRFVHGQGSGY